MAAALQWSGVPAAGAAYEDGGAAMNLVLLSPTLHTRTATRQVDDSGATMEQAAASVVLRGAEEGHLRAHASEHCGDMGRSSSGVLVTCALTKSDGQVGMIGGLTRRLKFHTYQPTDL